jgi:CRISPR-associated protein Cas4
MSSIPSIDPPPAPGQTELSLPFPELARDLPLLPARMLNEYQYCPRLAYLEWVQGEWAESVDTVEGRYAHRRVDRPAGDLPAQEQIDEGTRLHARSITLSSNRLGLIAKMDLIEADAGAVVPFDYKRGKRPHVAGGAYEPERVQLCAQALILEEHGYTCREGVLYFAGSKERVTVAFDEALQQLTRSAIDGLRLTAAGGRIPDPLVDSPKCPHCSLVGICLPDEVNYLRRNWKVGEIPDTLLDEFKRDVDQARRIGAIPELLGVEGNAAARHFGAFGKMIARDAEREPFAFDFTRRNRRPPADPVNAMLSYAYSLLVPTWTVTLTAVGFDAYRGFYHQPRYGRPALALDLMEPFRPLIADSAVIQAINNGEVKPADFVSAAGSISLTADGRKRFIAAFERRLGHEITHPAFGYRVSFRRLLELQARLLARHPLGELDDYPNFVTR